MNRGTATCFDWRFLVGLLCLVFSWLVADAARAACLTGTCHQDLQQLTAPHEPLIEEACDACHQETGTSHPGGGKPAFSLVAEGADLCLSCHDSVTNYRRIHEPVQDGLCTECHDPHQPGMGAVESVAAVCTRCHDAEPFSQQVQHGPVAVGDCLACHLPHSSGSPALLKKEGDQVCFSCHEDFAARMEVATTIHAAIEGQGCGGCHQVHGSANPDLLTEKLPELCFECHDDVEKETSRARVRHAAVQRPESCSTCHQTHFSDAPGLLNGPQRDVCFRCHGEDDHRRSNPLRNIEDEVAGKTFLHGAVSDGDCSACHQPHGSDYFRMLRGAYPQGFYEPYVTGRYDFCLRCHEPNMLRYAETSLYTQFRNGKQNLHALHVANPVKGRTCRVCHQPHASDAEKLIQVEGVPFGDWAIPVNYRRIDTGGSCAPGCHKQVAYDRENPVDYRR